MALFDPSQFTASKAKPLPVVLLLDTSGSMSLDTQGGNSGEKKIDSLNGAVRRMLGTFTREESQANEFLVSIVTFGGSASVATSPTPASEFTFRDLHAGGLTPFGEAIDVTKRLIEDKEQTPSRAYRPLVVLVSDGVPTDSWQDRLDNFIGTGRSAKCDRMALGIGQEAYEGPGRATLERFIAGTEHQVFEAKDAEEIHKFFRFVTMSVVTRSLSLDPNAVPKDATLQPPTTANESAADEDSYWG